MASFLDVLENKPKKTGTFADVLGTQDKIEEAKNIKVSQFESDLIRPKVDVPSFTDQLRTGVDVINKPSNIATEFRDRLKASMKPKEIVEQVKPTLTTRTNRYEPVRQTTDVKAKDYYPTGLIGDKLKEPLNRFLTDLGVSKTQKQLAEQTLGAASKVPGLISKDVQQGIREQQETGFTVPKLVPFVGGKEVGSFDIGRTGAELATMAAQYGVINKALQGTKLGATIASKFGNEAVGNFVSAQTADFLADTIIQRPKEIINNLQEGNDWDKGLAFNTLLDLGVNLAIGGAIDGKNILQSLKKTEPKLFDDAIKNIQDQNVRNTITEQLGDTVKSTEIATEQVESLVKPITPTDIIKTDVGEISKSKTFAEALEMERPITDDFLEDTLIVDLPKVATGTPIDTQTRISLDLPKRQKPNFKENIERFYQETINQRQPAIRAGVSQATASNLNRASGIVEYNVIGKQTDMLGNEIGDSVFDIFSQVPKESKKDLFDYSYNLHNIDRWNQGKPVFGETIDDTISQAKVSELLANNPEFEEINNKIVKYFQNNLDEWGVKSGLISTETAQQLKEMYPNYIPTYRVKDFPKSMSNESQTVANVLKKAKGSDEAILPLDQQMIMLTDKLVRNAKKNEALNELYKAFESGQSKGVVEVVDLPKTKVNDFMEIGEEFEIPTTIKDKYTLNFYVDGQPKAMTVDKNLYEAFNVSRNDSLLNELASAVNKYGTQTFKELVTGKNPFFAVSNIMRDIPTALVFSDNPLRLVKNVPTAVKEILTNGELYKKFKALGGTKEGLIGSGKNVKIPNLESPSQLKKAASQINKLNPVKTFGDINNFTEQLPRFAEFISVLEKTNNPALAIYKSAELTTDFSRFGKTTKSIDRVVPYLNASVQGLDRSVRQVVQNPISTAAKAGAVISVPTLILDQINKDNESYNSLNPRERNMYYQIPYTDGDGNQKFVRIPKSRELGVIFSSTLDWAARKARGQEVTGTEIAEAIEESFKPASITESFIFTPAIKAWKQIKDPDAYSTNFWGGLIVPQSERRFSPGQQYDENTSGIAKALGQQFNISPYVIDYLIDSYTGVLGDFIQPIGKETSPDVSFASLITEPFKKKFTTDPVYRSNDLSQFYDLLDKNQKEAQDYNRKNNIPSEEVTDLEKKYNAQYKVAREISDLNKEFKLLQTENASDKKLREMKQLINELARKAIKEFK